MHSRARRFLILSRVSRRSLWAMYFMLWAKFTFLSLGSQRMMELFFLFYPISLEIYGEEHTSARTRGLCRCERQILFEFRPSAKNVCHSTLQVTLMKSSSLNWVRFKRAADRNEKKARCTVHRFSMSFVYSKLFHCKWRCPSKLQLAISNFCLPML